MPKDTETFIRELEERLTRLEIEPFSYPLGGNSKKILDSEVGNILSNVQQLRGGQERYNVGTGFFLGNEAGAYKLSLGNPSGSRVTWDGTTLTIIGSLVLGYTAGDYLLASSDAEVSTVSTSYVKVKEIFVGSNSGTFRILFDLAIEASAFDSIGRIYRNGVAVGTERTTSADNPTFDSYTEDISGWVAGDLLQLYLKSSGGGKTAYAKNFRMKANTSPVPIVIT